jgi:hypothetical protein
VVTNFGLQRRDFSRGNIGRVGGHQVESETAAHGAKKVAAPYGHVVGAETQGVVARNADRIVARVGRDDA